MAVSSEQSYSLKTRKPVDEDSLLTEEDRAEKVANKAEDCSTRRRACKNCVCGRAELEKAQGVTIDDIPDGPPAGGCGGCSRGDAFRCAGCPFLGKPAWNSDEQGTVKLNMTDDI
jgi:anamorsin